MNLYEIIKAWATRSWLFAAQGVGLGLGVLTTISDFGQAIVAQVHTLWSTVFDLQLPGSTSTVGDWMVLSGVAYFLTVIIAAYLVKIAIMALKPIWRHIY